MEKHGFNKFTLPFEENLFDELSNSIELEDLAKGRKGNHIVALKENTVPIVRTSSIYKQPAYNFSETHQAIVEKIKRVVNSNIGTSFPALTFNNALIEIYDRNYRKMKYHSDQSLDLNTDSYIALFSCYEHPADLSTQFLRKLKVKNKITAEEFEFSLEHNSVLLFSLATNAQFSHKIVLDPVLGQKPAAADNRWLGITFRQSKTFIQFKDNLPYFPDGKLLTLADEVQKREFYQLRGQENNSLGFIYPDISYTLSIADTLMPKKD